MYNYDAGEYSAGCDDDIWAMFLASQRTKFDDTDVMINIKDHDEDEETVTRSFSVSLRKQGGTSLITMA